MKLNVLALIITLQLLNPVIHAVPVDSLRTETQEANQGATTPEKKTILEIQTDRAAFNDKTVLIHGRLEIPVNHVAPVEHSDETHYTFLLIEKSGDKTSEAFLYIRRGPTAEALRSLLLTKGGKMYGKFTVRIPENKSELSSTGLVAELIDYKEIDSGTVVVEVEINEKGDVIFARAISGHMLLRKAAVEAAYKAKFAPTKISGQAVKVKGTINYNFEY